MEPKNPIAINGVDVSECECFYINDSLPEYKECINTYYKSLCKDNPNCHYKRLKRKEQECERLKQTLAEILIFFKEDKNFARYSGRPIIFAKPALERIEKILKENDIEISEVLNE